MATYLLAHTGSGYSIAAAILRCPVVNLIAVSLMDDHSRSDIDDDASFGREVAPGPGDQADARAGQMTGRGA